MRRHILHRGHSAKVLGCSPTYIAGVVAVLLMLVAPASAFAGAWVQPLRGWYLNTTMLLFLSEDFYDLGGGRQSLGDRGKFEDLGFYLYAEYGVSKSLTLVTSVPYKRLEYRSTNVLARSSGIGDLYFGLKYGLAMQPYVLSVQAGLKLAPGYEIAAEKLDSAPPLGDGQTDFELRLLAGKSVLNFRGYVSFDAGYRARSGAPVDEVPFGAEFGYHLSRQLLGVMKVYGVRALGEDTGLLDPGRVGEGNLIGTGELEDFAKFQAQLIFRASSSFEIAILWEQIFAGRNTAAGTAIGVGVAFVRR